MGKCYCNSLMFCDDRYVAMFTNEDNESCYMWSWEFSTSKKLTKENIVEFINDENNDTLGSSESYTNRCQALADWFNYMGKSKKIEYIFDNENIRIY